jgi:hypothetical protein
VLLLIQMLASVYFDDQLNARCAKINNVRSNRMLATKMDVVQPVHAQDVPKAALCLGRMSAQFLSIGEGFSCWCGDASSNLLAI